MQVALITVSYRGDFELARDLCASVDAFVASDIEHVLVIPRQDESLFAPLVGGRRRLVVLEELLPRSAVRLPLPRKIDLGFYKKRLREMWLMPQGLVRGWIMQQIVKLSSNAATSREAIVFADSDLVFVRPVTSETFVHGDKVRLYHRPGETRNSKMHQAWHRAAARLLGLKEEAYFGADYIGNPISWRRDVLEALQQRLADVSGGSWQGAIARMVRFSEFILYGVFAETVLGEKSGHYFDTVDLTNPSWHFEQGGADDMDRFVAAFGKEHIAVLIQSTTDLPLAERRALIARMSERVSESR